MTDLLRDELRRIAETAPTADVPPDLFARARAAQRRLHVTVGLVACVLLVAAGALVAHPRHVRSTPQPASHPSVGAVPSRIYDYAEASQPHDAFDALRLGAPAVAAYTIDFEPDVPRAVVVLADGTYHLVLLPELRTGLATGDTRAYALSPDGSTLAYYYRGAKAGQTGIALYVPATGTVTKVRLGGRLGMYAEALAWSPNGRWLLWDGQPVERWTKGPTFATTDLAGRIEVTDGGDPSLSTVTLPRVQGGWGTAGVCDDGRVVARNPKGTWSWNGQAVRRTGAGGSVLATGCLDRDRVTSVSPTRDQGLESLQVLGWSADGVAVVRVASQPTDQAAPPDEQLALLPSGSTLISVVGRIDPGGPVTVATGLMSSAHPTTSLPPPPWAPSSSRAWVWVTLALALLALVAGLAWAVRRELRR